MDFFEASSFNYQKNRYGKLVSMLAKIFPFITWFEGYNSSKFKLDLVAGITVALVLIPQSMAYAKLAGLPPYYGLYAAFLPPMIAALFGSSRQLSTGPVAVVSLMTAASLETLATAGSKEFIAYAIMLSLTVGIFQLILGVFRLGLVVNFLSHPVVNGFTNAAAIIIATSQLGNMFGVYVDNAEHHYETIMRVFAAAYHYLHVPTLALGILAILIMAVLKKINPRIPNVLVAVVVCTLISWATGFNKDAKVALDSIKSPEVVQDIAAFNMEVKAIKDASTQRVTVMDEKEKAHAEHDKVREIDADHQAALIENKISSSKKKSGELRAKIREYLLTGVEAEGAGKVFFLKNALPEGAKTDGRTWRVRVGNSEIKDQEVMVMGAGAILGEIPPKLPELSIPKISMKMFLKLLPYAVIISLLGFMEAISIAKALAAKTGQKLDPNQELVGQGLANIIGSFGQSYPASGSFSRSAVNLQSGAVTGFSSVISSSIVVITLLFLTPLLYNLPQSVLAAIIMMAVVSLINVDGLVHAWKAKRSDGVITLISFVCTLIFAPHLDKGIMVGVGLSLAVFLYKSMKPRVAILAMSADNRLVHAEKHGLKECDKVAVTRFDGTLFFANASYLDDVIYEIRVEKPNLKHVILVCDGINDIDASGEESLSMIIDRTKAAGIDISLAGVKEAVMAVLERTHLIEKIGERNIYSTKEIAVQCVYEKTHLTDDERMSCPLVCYIPEKQDSSCVAQAC